MSGTQKELHQKILNQLHNTYIRKNQDYGNSFSEQYNEYGMLSLVIRLDDKLRRLKQLNKGEALVKDESIEDTLLDLANYAIMGAMELKEYRSHHEKPPTPQEDLEVSPQDMQRTYDMYSRDTMYE